MSQLAIFWLFICKSSNFNFLVRYDFCIKQDEKLFKNFQRNEYPISGYLNVFVGAFDKLATSANIRTPNDLKFMAYRISSVISRRYFPSKNNPKNLDPSNKTDLDLWDYLGRVKLVL